MSAGSDLAHWRSIRCPPNRALTKGVLTCRRPPEAPCRTHQSTLMKLGKQNNGKNLPRGCDTRPRRFVFGMGTGSSILVRHRTKIAEAFFILFFFFRPDLSDSLVSPLVPVTYCSLVRKFVGKVKNT